MGDVSEKQLTINISRTSVSVAEVFRSNQTIHWQKDYALTEDNNEGYRNQLYKIFDALEIQKDYKEYTLAWGTAKHTLVPLHLFNNSSAQTIFEFVFGKEENKLNIDFNRLMELSMVEVFEIPEWVKSFFIRQFPMISIKHEHTMLLRALFQMNTFDLKIVVNVWDEYFTICVLQKGELLFSNSFEYQQAEDIIYHLFYVVERENLNQEKGKIQFYYSSEKAKERIKEVENFIKTTKNLNLIEIDKIESVVKLHVLCV